MALPYSCCRMLIFQHSLRSVKNNLYHPLKQNVRRSAVSSMFKSEFQAQNLKLVHIQNFFRRGFRTKRISEEIESHTPGNESPSLVKHFLFTVGVCHFEKQLMKYSGTTNYDFDNQVFKRDKSLLGDAVYSGQNIHPGPDCLEIVCGCSFTGAMIWNYEKMRKVFQDLQSGVKKESVFEKKHKKALGFREHANSLWTKLSGGQKMVIGIMAANVGVFLLWRITALQPMMIQYFTTSIGHPLPSMMLSSFSHVSFLHLFVNMYVLWSFASVSVNMFGFEQFAAFYLSAGTISSFASMACSKLLKRPYIVSVGASGAIMAMLGAVCSSYPNAQLGIAFISDIFPHSFSADSGMKAIIAFDLLGLVLGWRFLDHAGHLGGIFFGILYAKYGNKLVWGNRETIMKWWHDLRGKP